MFWQGPRRTATKISKCCGWDHNNVVLKSKPESSRFPFEFGKLPNTQWLSSISNLIGGAEQEKRQKWVDLKAQTSLIMALLSTLYFFASAVLQLNGRKFSAAAQFVVSSISPVQLCFCYKTSVVAIKYCMLYIVKCLLVYVWHQGGMH